MENIDGKINAAYALNLCTVSVSQILDYEDLNVMEQEYEAILNNLNLENMPHDEALLSILKQLLDTITFFRIDAGDKKMLERQYKDKMKNAIWNAVPNFGLFVAGVDPITMGISLASQIGIGYMNYRKAKASNQLDYESQLWKLQRTAIEQINALQRELFDTSWRLADAYGFDDRLRLSERQIKHYDSILMDDNALRKYDRLDSVKDNFIAYPPFWYHLGNTANDICRDSSLSISDETRQYFREKAKEHFKQFWDSNKFPLLREDQLASSCALEYADLLIEDGADREQIIGLLDKAVKYAGNAWDVLQLCAIGYIRVNALDKAIPALRILVNEKYNSSVNAQFLSSIYISEYINNNDASAKSQYEALACRVSNQAYMLPWPTGDNNPEEEFYNNQRDMLSRRYRHMIDSYRDKYTVLFNKIIPIPEDDLEQAGADYTEAHRDERYNAMEHVLASPKSRDMFLSVVNDIGFGVEYINLLNKMLSSISSLSVVADFGTIVPIAEKKISKEAKTIENIQARMREFSFSIDDYAKLQTITSEEFLTEVFDEVKRQISSAIEKMNNMLTISIATSEMVEFCHSENIPLPESREDKLQEILEGTGKQIYISPKVLGDKAEYFSKVMAKKEVMSAIIKKKLEKSLNGGVNMLMIYPGSDAFNDYFSKGEKALKSYKNDVLAILDDKAFLFDTDLLFTTTGILVVERNSIKAICSYDDVEFDRATNKLMIGSINYRNTNVNSEKMYASLVELKHSSSKR